MEHIDEESIIAMRHNLTILADCRKDFGRNRAILAKRVRKIARKALLGQRYEQPQTIKTAQQSELQSVVSTIPAINHEQ